MKVLELIRRANDQEQEPSPGAELRPRLTVVEKRIDLGRDCLGCELADISTDGIWCSYERGRFVNTEMMDDCPLDREEITHLDLFSGNAVRFGCRDCPHADLGGCRAWCRHNPSTPRLIASWGYCPRDQSDGPERGWRHRRSIDRLDKTVQRVREEG